MRRIRVFSTLDPRFQALPVLSREEQLIHAGVITEATAALEVIN